jgi:hypothetical protein
MAPSTTSSEGTVGEYITPNKTACASRARAAKDKGRPIKM